MNRYDMLHVELILTCYINIIYNQMFVNMILWYYIIPFYNLMCYHDDSCLFDLFGYMHIKQWSFTAKPFDKTYYTPED